MGATVEYRCSLSFSFRPSLSVHLFLFLSVSFSFCLSVSASLFLFHSVSFSFCLSLSVCLQKMLSILRVTGEWRYYTLYNIQYTMLCAIYNTIRSILDNAQCMVILIYSTSFLSLFLSPSLSLSPSLFLSVSPSLSLYNARVLLVAEDKIKVLRSNMISHERNSIIMMVSFVHFTDNFLKNFLKHAVLQLYIVLQLNSSFSRP